MSALKKETCKDKVEDSLKRLLSDWRVASIWCGKTERDLKIHFPLEGQEKDIAHFEQYLEYESFYDYVNQTALSWDFVEANTFNDQKVGYYRLQLSWGGPSTEFRIYTDKDLNISYIEYWYLDWYDGASVLAHDSIVMDLMQQFLEIESYD